MTTKGKEFVVCVSPSLYGIRGRLLDDAETKMRNPRSLDHPGAFQFNGYCAQVVEQSDTVTQQDGREIDVDFVEQPGLDALLCDTRAAYGDIRAPCCFLCLANGAFNTVGDEGERRSFLEPLLWGGMRDDKTRSTSWGVATPRMGDVEHPPPRHHCSDCRPFLPKEVGTGA